MSVQILFAFICDDRPGVVEALADCVKRCEGNWLESNMAQLAGKFTGNVQLSVAEDYADKLLDDLNKFNAPNFQLITTKVTPEISTLPQLHWNFTIYGNDRPGIVREVTQAFANRHINLEKLQSRCTSMPHIGTPLFEAEGRLTFPDNTDFEELENCLDKISDELAIDIQLAPAPNE